MVAAMDGSAASPRDALTALRDVLLRRDPPMAAWIDGALYGSNSEIETFLTSDRLWGLKGSMVLSAGAIAPWAGQREVEEAYLALGRWQIAHGYTNPDVMGWVGFLERRIGLPAVQTALPATPLPAGPAVRSSVPWTVRDSWLGLFSAVVIIAAMVGLVYYLQSLSAGLDADLVAGVFMIVFELLFLVPVWWFAVRKHHASLRSLGFVRFKPSVAGLGIALLLAIYAFNGVYQYVLDQFGLRPHNDLAPVAEQLSYPWLLIIATVIVAPLVEEAFFRGFFFAGLRTRYDWRWAAVISAALFSAFHLDLVFFVPGFLLGFLFAYLYERSGSIWPGVIVHAVTNALAMSVVYLQM